MLTLETILKDSVWVAKMQGWRTTGTYGEIGHLAEDPECRDFDLCAIQPDHLKEFYDAYFKYELEHGFITVQDFYNKTYKREAERLTHWNGKKWILPQGRWREIAEKLAAYENTGCTPDEIAKMLYERRQNNGIL